MTDRRPAGRVTDRELNRWTLARQHLVERVALDVEAAVESLAGMQAQHSPSPYIGLWSRLEGFEREHLAAALREDRIVKATLMRGTLHLVPTSRLAAYRAAAGSAYYADTLRRLDGLGADLDAVRAAVVAEVARRPRSRPEIAELIVDLLPGDLPGWLRERPTGVAALVVTTDLVNLADDAAYGYFGGSRYRVAPPSPPVDPADAVRSVVAAYLAAFGPASRADLAQWSGNTVRALAAALDELELERFTAEDGRTLLDLPGAPRPPADRPVPVRFLPKWDNLLLAYTRRERVLPEPHRKVVIRKNGDVLPTFLVDGTVAGTWAATSRGPGVMTLTALGPVRARDRKAVEAEGARLLAWLRPDATARSVRWA